MWQKDFPLSFIFTRLSKEVWRIWLNLWLSDVSTIVLVSSSSLSSNLRGGKYAEYAGWGKSKKCVERKPALNNSFFYDIEESMHFLTAQLRNFEGDLSGKKKSKTTRAIVSLHQQQLGGHNAKAQVTLDRITSLKLKEFSINNIKNVPRNDE